MQSTTLADLRAVLLGLGFVDRSVPGKYHRFEHPMPDTFVLLPPLQDGDVLRPGHLAEARILLDYRGILSRQEFDEALRQRSLAG